MALFCAAIRSDSVSLLRFPFLSHVQVFSSEISLVCLRKCLYCRCSYHFLFSCYFCSVDPYVVCIVSGRGNQPYSALFMLSSSRCIDALTLSWMLVSSLPLSFLGSCSLSMSFLGCKVLCNVMSFLVLWFICWSSSLVHFKNDPEYLTRGMSWHELLSLGRSSYFPCLNRIGSFVSIQPVYRVTPKS